MNHPSALPLVSILSVCLIFVALFGAPSCTAVAGLLNLGGMTDAEFEAWYPTATAEVGAALRAAEREGEIDSDQAAVWAADLSEVAQGELPVPHDLAGWLGVESWGSVGLELAVIELDGALRRNDAWGSGGKAALRARMVAGALAEQFAGLAPVPAAAPPG